MKGVPALVALGASLGERARVLGLAARALDAAPGLRLVAASRLYLTPPAGGVARCGFLNAVLLLDCELEPGELLALCQEVERRLGRRTAVRWADRAVDLDLLLVGDAVLAGPRLALPHPRLGERPFVWVPMEEVWPGVPDPRTGRPWPSPPGPRPVPVGVLAPLRRASRARLRPSPGGIPAGRRRTA